VVAAGVLPGELCAGFIVLLALSRLPLSCIDVPRFDPLRHDAGLITRPVMHDEKKPLHPAVRGP